MAGLEIVRNEFVCAEDIDGDNLRCPRHGCASTHLVLRGTSQVPRIETMNAGQVTEVEIQEWEHAFEIETIECLVCRTRWHIQTREVAALQRHNQLLRQRVIDLTGQDPYGVEGRVH